MHVSKLYINHFGMLFIHKSKPHLGTPFFNYYYFDKNVEVGIESFFFFLNFLLLGFSQSTFHKRPSLYFIVLKSFC